jgi:hypothetical protein
MIWMRLKLFSIDTDHDFNFKFLNFLHTNMSQKVKKNYIIYFLLNYFKII